MSLSSTFNDPLTVNLRRQTDLLLKELPAESYATALRNVSSRYDALGLLSNLLALPAYTIAVATAFRPLLLDLCSRWLLNEEDTENRLEALCLLLEVHQEIFPVLSAFLRRPQFERGPLTSLINHENLQSVDAVSLQRVLLAYYRILQANRTLPRTLNWSLTPLSQLIWAPHPDNGVRFLAIRCYALQSGMMEAERVKMEKELIGDVGKVDCPLAYGAALDGSTVFADGWIMPALEVSRIAKARNAHLEPQKYYTYEDGDSIEPIHPAELSPFITSIHGILMFRLPPKSEFESRLIATPTAIHSLRTLAAHISLGVPTLLTSSPSCGKSLLLEHLAATLHPHSRNHVVSIHLADTSLDPRSLLGSYVSSHTRSGAFDWKEGVLVRAMREGKWVVLEDIDRGSSEVLGLLKPLVESLGVDKWIGGRATLEVPGRGRVEAEESFALFATRSVSSVREDKFPPPSFYGAHRFHEVIVPSPTHEDLRLIVDTRFPQLAGVAAEGFIKMWEAARALGSTASTRDIGLRELEKLCVRVDKLLPPSHQAMDVDADSGRLPHLSETFPNPTVREDMYLEARDVLFGAGAATASARAHSDALAAIVAEHLGLAPERRDWVLEGRLPEFQVEKDVNGSATAVRLGRVRLVATSSKTDFGAPSTRPFAMHKPAVVLLSRIASAVSLGEPVLLTGETGTGKTSVISHLSSLLRKPLISLNLSNQTESSDIIGGFKPVDARVPASELQAQFLDLFGGTFSRKKNAKFEDSVRKAVQESKWKRAVALWIDAAKLAKERIRAKPSEEQVRASGETPRKRRKVDQELNISEARWDAFERDVRIFEVQHVQGEGRFAFGFVEGPLVKALRQGHWILLDEINLASPETLECVSALLHGPTASITLTEQGSLEPIPRHPDFRLFACMNPATDVGKKDLPPHIRARFSEIDVPPPDADRETLLSIVGHYIGPYAVGDKGAIMDVAEFYRGVRKLADAREIADGSNQRPHFSMRTLSRALTFAADMTSSYSLRRALWEGCLMAFTMVLDKPSAALVTALAQKHILAGVRNPRSLLSREPSVPQGRSTDEFVKFGPFYLERGPLPEDPMEAYIMTPSVETKLIDLARIIATRRFPVLIEGPTSSGKTSSIEYLAKRTGHRFVRINNHEHTDIQEYLGTYVSDPATGKLVFKDGLLVRALRNGDWIVLDELNLAPTDVLEALNRLLDDNRELLIPETQEVVRPHPHFMLFATQNPPGLYAGRKVLSRAFRNRFLEVHFEDVPQAELEAILCQRCRIAPSHGQRIVAVFRELQKRRQSSRIFESKEGFATLRDLFRWAGRDAIDYQELAENGYMLLAERARRIDDKTAVKEVIESVMKVRIDEERLYTLHGSKDLSGFLGCPVPTSSNLVWTTAMQRLFILVARALRFNEPVLLVGETGCGKTSVCQLYAQVISKMLHTVNCHQNTETADLIGGLRPVRNRAAIEADTMEQAAALLGISAVDADVKAVTMSLENRMHTAAADEVLLQKLEDLRSKLTRLSTLFEWHDGPLVQAMRAGDVFLLDEISLADDSVLERLNSVLEPDRTLVLAERGGDNVDLPFVNAAHGFKLVATMNPGGDYGKKELSPALRNRFTEIWVPPVEDRRDLERIVDGLWGHESLKVYTERLLDFAEWLSARVSDKSIISLRDILAWVEFSNTLCSPASKGLDANQIFHHAAHLTFLDGLGSLQQLSSYSRAALADLKSAAIAKLQEIAPVRSLHEDGLLDHDPATHVQIGSFSIPRGPCDILEDSFSLQAPTTRDNVNRVARACQLTKPVLLEGSPGVGKTSLIAALANQCGYKLSRINLSDQTDLVDLFGSDLPVEGGSPGQFAWKDADFLRALQEGHWVLLDEMNLAPQAVLEGLNAVLDHRGTVYIPELGRSFCRHPSFRIFAAQNPLQQGGGRKGLPKSFLNRFTKVYVQELTSQDFVLVCRNLFPEIPVELLQGMIDYITRLTEEVNVKRTFAREGAPWEFNLRDVLRWSSLIRKSRSLAHPGHFLNVVILHRFRTAADRAEARSLFESIFPDAVSLSQSPPELAISPAHIQAGHFLHLREGFTLGHRPGRLLQSRYAALESMGLCIDNKWLTILTGSQQCGKTSLVRLMAHLAGRSLHEISINSATDATDILGSFEEVDAQRRVLDLLGEIISLLDRLSASSGGSRLHLSSDINALRSATRTVSSESLDSALQTASQLLHSLASTTGSDRSRLLELSEEAQAMVRTGSTPARFEWVDGPLVHAVRSGHWILLDGANLCNPSVLDRLNSLCEAGGTLTLNERGAVNGQVEILKPHPNFRIFMCVDPQYGELSRAMRNRGIEVALLSARPDQDGQRALDHLRLPVAYGPLSFGAESPSLRYELVRRATCTNEFAMMPRMEVPTTRLLGEDSASSALVDLASSMDTHLQSATPAQHALLYFMAQSSSPAYILYCRRFINACAQAQPRLLQVSSMVSLLSRRPPSAISDLYWNKMRQCTDRPLELLTSQPMHRTMHNLTQDVTSSSDVPAAVLLVLHLFVATFIINEENVALDHGEHWEGNDWINETQVASSRRTKTEIISLVQAIKVAGEELCDHVDFHDAGVESDLNHMLRLLGYARYLKKVLHDGPLDLSAVQVASQWIADALVDRQRTDNSRAMLELEVHAKALSAVVSLTSGLGLSEIWTNLFPHPPPTSRLENLAILESAARSPKMYGLRSQIFELMALSTLPVHPSNEEKTSLTNLEGQVIAKLSQLEQVIEPDLPEKIDPLFLIAELMILASLALDYADIDEETSVEAVSKLLDLAIQDSRMNLSRFIPYRHLIWASRARRADILLGSSLHKQWLESTWSVSSMSGVDGPAVLCRPAVLWRTVQHCDWDKPGLDHLTSYEASLHRNMGLISLQFNQTMSRIIQLARIFLQSVLMVLLCFHQSFDEADYATIRGLSATSVLDLGSACRHLTALVGRSKHSAFRDAFDIHLRPAIEQIPSTCEEALLSQLGHCWIAFCSFFLDLFVPDSPIDPAALQRCSEEYEDEERSRLLAQIELHTLFEMRTSGEDSNNTIRYLVGMLENVPSKSAEERPRHSQRNDLSRLQAYWSEVHQFTTHVVSSHKISALILALRNRDRSVQMREQVIQDSITSFCQRLAVVYPDFDDISRPLQFALAHMKLGLRLVYDTMTHDEKSSGVHLELAASLLAFPSVSSAEGFRIHRETSTGSSSTISSLLVKLAAMSFENHIGIGMQVRSLESLYEQILGLWLVDRARREEREREDQSLYRRKDSDEDMLGEAEMEEEDFLTIFPEFRDVLDSGTMETSRSGQKKQMFLVDPTQASQLFEIHQQMFLPHNSGYSLSSDTSVHFLEARRSLLRTLMDGEASSWPGAVDETSLPFQVALICDRLSSLAKRSHRPGRPYDYYFDDNVPEMRRAIAILQGFRERLAVLILEWPDQMVLQHIKNRCEAILNLSLQSPIAKVLSALEQLLLHTEDWEMYANRDNSLKTYQQALISLIVDWRRLELSAWQDLLESQAITFANAAAEWWFRLYEAAIRGLLLAAQETEGDEAVTRYLDNFVPLVDDFITHSPIGQYQTRLQLLHSMELYIDQLAKAKTGPSAAALRRVCCVLHSSRLYYQQFEMRVSASVTAQRADLDKEIRGFVKLASWKDINVHALKQSAQKTHRQLYKSIRKFREVLRQPVATLLHSTASGDQDQEVPKNAQLHQEERRISLTVKSPEFPETPEATALPPHLAHIGKTFQRFHAVITTRLMPLIQSRTPQSVESLAGDILFTSKTLASTPIPADLTPTRRAKLQKNLLTRKRKAWSDMLKELKRVGLSGNIKPEILALQKDKRWLREQPVISSALEGFSAIEKAEDYLRRIAGNLPELRDSLSNHHPDLSTRDLHRAIMFVESCFMFAMQSRSCFAKAVTMYQEIQQLSRRLHALSSSPQIKCTGEHAINSISYAKNTAYGLANALEELVSLLRDAQSHHPCTLAPGTMLEEADSVISSLKELAGQLLRVWQQVGSTRHPMLLQGEYTLIAAAVEYFAQCAESLRKWSFDTPRISCFVDPIRTWLNAQKQPPIPDPHGEMESKPEYPLVDFLLLKIQNMLGVCPESPDDDMSESSDNYIRETSRVVSKFTDMLQADSLAHELSDLLLTYAYLPADDVRRSIARLSPFLDRYIQLVEEQLQNQSQWCKSLFKLNYVLCSIMRTIAKDGFCQPPETEETESGGEGQASAEGMGMGQGQGDENVSKDIQDESQVEGLQTEEGDSDEKVERAEEGNAIEMSEDIGGSLEDVPDAADEDNADEESQADLEDQVGQLDASDPSAVDEKLWGDEAGPEDQDQPPEKSNKDHSAKQDGKSELVAKDGEQPKEKKASSENEDIEAPAEAEPEVTGDETSQDEGEEGGPDGAPMDDHVQDANTLDLPDDMKLESGQESKESQMDDDDSMSDVEDRDEDADNHSDTNPDQDQDVVMDEPDGGRQAADLDDSQEQEEESQMPPPEKDEAIAQPDLHGGDGSGGVGSTSTEAAGAEGAEMPQEQGSAVLETGTEVPSSKDTSEGHHADLTAQKEQNSRSHEQEMDNDISSSAAAAAPGSQEGSAQLSAKPTAQSSSTNPLRSLGDALKDITQRFDEILNGDGSSREQRLDYGTQQPLEYVQPDDTEQTMQALGPAGQDEVAKLNELKLVDEEEQQASQDYAIDDLQSHEDPPQSGQLPQPTPMQAESTSTAPQEHVDSALTSSDVHRLAGSSADILKLDEPMHPADHDHNSLSKEVEMALRLWQSEGQPSEQAEHIWRLYESLTHDLSYALCEQLRLILAPTLATRLRGDYRTGKRLNMKKIIPYIASEFTKDKIWLRRTRPSQREYQILIALDDSRSMAESHSVHLAFQTLALVSKALNRLEVGDVAVAKFGQSVEVLHGFGGEPFTDRAGTKIVDAFHFDQKATQVLSLLEISLAMLEKARESRSTSSASAGDLWQMEIIISDGVCQDHERLRTVLRKAEEQRVMVVFIILDSLHTKDQSVAGGRGGVQNSILSMNQVGYQDVGGRMDLKVTRYLDTFPFEYYVVVRDVEALPEVLSGTLKQFFERISEE